MEESALNEDKKNRLYFVSLSIATVVIGILSGWGANLLGWELNFFEKVFLQFKENPHLPVSMYIDPWQRLLSVFIGSIIAAIAWYILHKKYYLNGVNEALQGKKMSFIGTTIHDIIQTFYIGTGGSVGREAAPREFGAMLAQKWSELTQRFKIFALTKEDTKLLIAAAAGAGLAGQYVTPLSGTLFSLELLNKNIKKKSVIVCLTMSVIATLVGTIRNGFKAYYIIEKQNISFDLIPLTLFLGPILGILGVIFRKFVDKAKKKRITDKRILITLPTAGLLTGIVAYFYPYIMGNGRGLAQLAYNTDKASISVVLTLAICLIAKAIITTLTICNGAYGGILTPSISMGAACGTIAGIIYLNFYPGISLFECGLVGSVAFLASSQQAPLMSLFLVFELCHLDVSAFVPLGMAAAISVGVSTLISSKGWIV